MKCSLLVLLTVFRAANAADDKPACVPGFTCTNGQDVGPVVYKGSCQAACQSCKGGEWRCTGYKSVEAGANTTGANETAATYNFCRCGKVATDSSCTTNQWRDLCMDPGYATAAAGSAGLCFGLLAMAVVAAVLSW